MRTWLVIACALAALSAGAQEPTGLAPLPAPPPSEESLESIHTRLDRLELENAELRARLDGVDAPPMLVGAPERSALYEDDAGAVIPCACNDPACPHCQHARRNGAGAASEYPTLSWSGFLQLDTGWVSQDAINKLAVGDIQAQTGIRRARLRAKGRVRADVSYVVDLDFAASGHPSFRDVKFVAHDRPLVHDLTIGYFQQPFGLDAMTSGRNLIVMERSLPFAFAPFRQPGIGSQGTALGESVTWSHSGFAFPTDSYGVSEGDRGGWAYAARVTALMLDDPEQSTLLHFGGSYCFQDPGNDIVRYAIEPGFFVTDPDDMAVSGNVPVFVDTGAIPAQNINLAGVESVGVWGPWSLQAEAVRSYVNPDAGPQLEFAGASAKLGYVLTGESQRYSRRRGVLAGVTPDAPTSSFFDVSGGAWEIVGAWAWIDLDDGGVEGGELQTIIFGVNRYMNSYVKLQLNVVRALLDDPATGRSAATVAALRAQAEF